jgi:hypothetical protein
MVAPYSGDILAIVALSARDNSPIPSPTDNHRENKAIIAGVDYHKLKKKRGKQRELSYHKIQQIFLQHHVS